MSLEDRVSSLESGLQDIRSILQDISAKIVSPEQTSAEPAPTITPTPEAPAINSTPDTPSPSAIPRSVTADNSNVINPTEDAQATFASIKASIQHVRLPAELTLASSGASGLKKGDQQSHTLLSKIGRYAETIFKVLQAKDDPYEDIFACVFALMRFLQEEQASLLVQSSFDPTVARFFRNLRRGGGLTPDAIEDLRSAASIAAVYRPPQQHQSYQSQRSFGRGQQSFQQRDFFRSSLQRNFPTQRGGRGVTRQGASSHQTPSSTSSPNED